MTTGRRQRRAAGARLLVKLLALLALLAGCPGERPKPTAVLDRGTSGLIGDWRPWEVGEGTPLPWGDLKVGKGDGRETLFDGGAGKIDQPVVGPGCQCRPDEFCLDGKCLRKCVTSGPCNVDSICADHEICILVTNQSVFLCMPATAAPGGACDQKTLWCPNHYVCVYPTGAVSGVCRPQCTSPGVACPGGGTCTQYQACMFCWTPP